LNALGNYSCETIRMSIGSESLFAESLPGEAFRHLEDRTFLGDAFQEWLSAGEPTESAFLLPYEAAFRPKKVSALSQSESLLYVPIDEDGTPDAGSTDDRQIVGHDHPFDGFLRTSITHCLRERGPLYFRISMTLDRTRLGLARLLLPSVDDRDRIARIDIFQRSNDLGEMPEGRA